MTPDELARRISEEIIPSLYYGMRLVFARSPDIAGDRFEAPDYWRMPEAENLAADGSEGKSCRRRRENGLPRPK
jgi:hypothetical protein